MEVGQKKKFNYISYHVPLTTVHLGGDTLIVKDAIEKQAELEAADAVRRDKPQFVWIMTIQQTSGSQCAKFQRASQIRIMLSYSNTLLKYNLVKPTERGHAHTTN